MRVRQALSTSVGTKLLIATTGLALVGFLIGHLIGNLLLFLGPETFNAYGHALISNPLIIPVEIGLIAIFLLHAGKAVLNFFDNRAARPRGYELKTGAGGPSRKSWGSTTMIGSGLFVLAFVPFHLFTFKYGPDYPSAEPGVRDLYRLTVEVFQSPAYVVFYLFAMVIVGMHLRHGVSSSLQSLGVIPDRWTRAFLRAGLGLALVIGGGFVLIPIVIFLFIRPS